MLSQTTADTKNNTNQCKLMEEDATRNCVIRKQHWLCRQLVSSEGQMNTEKSNRQRSPSNGEKTHLQMAPSTLAWFATEIKLLWNWYLSVPICPKL